MAVVTETFARGNAGRKVDANGVVPDVKIIGNDSLNGRRYPDPVIAEGIGRYNRAKVYMNHPKGRDGALERDLRDCIGVIEAPYAKTGGGFGQLKLRKKHRDYESIVELINDFDGDFGFSHVADIDKELRGGIEHVTKIGEVFSVDLVTDPATTKGIFESKAPTMKKTLKQIVESKKGLKAGELFGELGRRVLEEAIATGEMPATAEVETPAEGGSDEDAIKAGLKNILLAKIETADAAMMKSMLKAAGIGDSISELLGGPGPETNTSAPNADAGNPPSPPADKPEEKKEMESRIARLEAENMLHKLGREATEAQIIAVASVPVANRKAVAESFPAKAAGATRESRGSRPDSSPPANGGTNSEAAIESYGNRIAERVKEARAKLAKK